MSEPEQFEKANLEFLYEALSEPVSVHSSTPTFPSSPVLDSSFLRDIKFQYEEQARNEVTEIKQLQREILGRSEQRLQDQMSLAHICQVIKINALLKRPVEAEQAFNLIHKWRLEPNTESVNELLLAYSEVGDWEKTLTTYRQHFEVIDSSGRFAASSSATSSHTSSQSSLTASALSSTSLTTLKSANTNPASLINHQNQANLLIPNEETFKHVIRALTKQGQLKQALELEAKWRNSGTVTLPQSIYTDIIACTIKNGQVDRAWEIFNYMQTYLHAPNSIAFTLMIKACAIRQEAERALDLVTRMTDSNVPLSDMAFTFLIQAVGSRPDYYAESFRLFEQMILQGFTPNLYTYNALLDSCSKHGDIARARMIWNDMMQRYLDDRLSSSSSSSAASSSMKPNIYIVQSMFKVFSHALKLYGKQDPKTEPIWGLPAFTSTQPEAEEPLRVPVSSDSNTHGIIFQTGKITPQLVVAEANALMSYISGLGKEEGGEESIGVGGTDKLTSLDTRLVNTYLSVIAHSGIRDVESFETGLLAVYKEMFTIENGPWGQRVSHLGYKMKPDGFTHFLLLKAASRKKDVFEKYGIDLWKQFVEWDNEQERQLVEMVAPVMEDQIQDKGLENHLTDDTGIRNGSGGSAFGSFLSPVLSEQEKEEKRLQQSRDKNVVFKMLVFMVKGYTR